MKKTKKIILLTAFIAIAWCSAITVSAVTWEFGTSGEGVNQFVPRGFVIVKDDGMFWLTSQFDNSGPTVMYSGKVNGITYIDAAKIDGSTYSLYAYVDRNPLVYNDYIVAYKDNGNGSQAISGFSSYIGAAGRLDVDNNMSSGANWGVPISGFTFEPGTKYEFAFLRGMTANNGITLVLSGDRKGYIQNPDTEEEISKYEAEKFSEYLFVTSYWKVLGDSEGGDDYYFGYNLVEMRFSVQTYADLTIWETAAEEAQNFINGVTQEDINTGKYQQSNIDNLSLLLDKQKTDADQTVKKKLQVEAEQRMQTMVAELKVALDKAKSSEIVCSDISVLKETLLDAQALYDRASANIGNSSGQYGEVAVANLQQTIADASTLTNRNPQTQVNSAVDSLNQAITKVNNSRLGGKTITLTDNGVRVIVPQGAVPADTTLSVNTASDQMSSYPALKEYFGDGVEEILMYDIKLYSGGVEIQPTSEAEIQIPVDSSIRDKAISIYAVDDGTNPTRIGSSKINIYRSFRSDKVGIFSLVVKGANYDNPVQESPPGQETGVTETGGSGTSNNGNNEASNSGDVGASGTGSPASGGNGNSAQTTTATNIEETNIDTGMEPDSIDEELVETEGAGEALEALTNQSQKVNHELLSSIDIPYDQLRRSAEPGWIIILSAFLAASAVIISIYKFAKYLIKRRVNPN